MADSILARRLEFNDLTASPGAFRRVDAAGGDGGAAPLADGPGGHGSPEVPCCASRAASGAASASGLLAAFLN